MNKLGKINDNHVVHNTSFPVCDLGELLLIEVLSVLWKSTSDLVPKQVEVWKCKLGPLIALFPGTKMTCCLLLPKFVHDKGSNLAHWVPHIIYANIWCVSLSLSFIHAGVDITKRVDDSIHGIFMDPTARHMIVSMKSQESFYLARDSKKPKPLAKMKVSVVCNYWQ